MTIMNTPAASADVAVPARRRVRGGALWRAVRHNRKALAGTVILGFFVVLALVPDQIAPGDPAASRFGRSLGASSHHLFGTTGFGQDIAAQVVHGTRPI